MLLHVARAHRRGRAAPGIQVQVVGPPRGRRIHAVDARIVAAVDRRCEVERCRRSIAVARVRRRSRSAVAHAEIQLRGELGDEGRSRSVIHRRPRPLRRYRERAVLLERHGRSQVGVTGQLPEQFAGRPGPRGVDRAGAELLEDRGLSGLETRHELFEVFGWARSERPPQINGDIGRSRHAFPRRFQFLCECRDDTRAVPRVLSELTGTDQSGDRAGAPTLDRRVDVGRTVGNDLRVRPRPRIVQVRQLRGRDLQSGERPGIDEIERERYDHQYEPWPQPAVGRRGWREHPREIGPVELNVRELVRRSVGRVGLRIPANHHVP